MPFTVDPASYYGPKLIAQGGANLGSGILAAGEGIAKAMAESKKMEEEQAADQVILNYGKQIGLVTPEIEADYIKGGHAQKTGIVGGLLRKFTMNQQNEQLQSLKESRSAQAEERQQRIVDRKTAADNAILATEPPTDEQRADAQLSGHDILFNPAKQAYELVKIGGGEGAASDKVEITLPDGRKAMVTGGQALKAQQPLDFKKRYGITQAQFSDTTTTDRGRVEEGNFVKDPNGDFIRTYKHKASDGTDVYGPVVPFNEWNQNRNAPSASQATSTPPRGDVKASGKVRMQRPDGKVGMVPADQVDDAISQGFKKL